MMEALQVIIVHWNAPEPCLAALRAFRSQDLSLGISIVDNNSDAEALERLRAGAGDVEFVTLTENRGFGGAANVALRSWLDGGRGDWVAVAAHDAVPEPHCLDLLIRELRKRPWAGLVCPEYGIGHRPVFSALRGARLVDGERGTGWESILLPFGTLAIFRRECLLDIGLFDERYFAYGEEHDIGLRARRAGWDVGLVWGAIVQNPGCSVSSEAACYLQMRNSLLLVGTHLGMVAAAARSAVALASTGRLLLARSSRPMSYSALARVRAVRDFWLGRFGSPPCRLLRPATRSGLGSPHP